MKCSPVFCVIPLSRLFKISRIIKVPLPNCQLKVSIESVHCNLSGIVHQTRPEQSFVVCILVVCYIPKVYWTACLVRSINVIFKVIALLRT